MTSVFFFAFCLILLSGGKFYFFFVIKLFIDKIWKESLLTELYNICIFSLTDKIFIFLMSMQKY